MARIKIPPSALSGFTAISKLDESQIKVISDYLENMPVGTKMQDVDGFLSYTLNIDESQNIVQTLRSFSELLQPPNVDFEALASNLASSYKEQANDEVTENTENNLRRNLYFIFIHSTNLKLTLKAYDLIGEDNYLFTNAKIVTDIRLVFNDDIEDSARNAFVVHYLHIDYFKDGLKKIQLTLDLSDLKKLKGQLERAINKEDIIKKDYEKSFNFLNLSSDE